MRRIGPILLIALLGCGGDDDGPPAGDPDGSPPAACDPMAEDCTYRHDFGVYEVAAGQEIDGLCQSWTLDNPTELWVSEVELDNDGAYHHGNWLFVPDDSFEVPDGAWSCDDHEFDELIAAILGGVLFAQSTQ